MRRIGDSGRETCTCAAYEVCYCILQNSHFIIKRNRDRPSPPVLPQVTDTCVPSRAARVRRARAQQRGAEDRAWTPATIPRTAASRARWCSPIGPLFSKAASPRFRSHGGLCFPKAGGESRERRASVSPHGTPPDLPAVWNKFLGSFEWPQTYLLYHTNDPPARTYCTRAFGRVAHTFISQRHRFFILRGGEL
jgi:hypothetical protein